ncbi:MAG: hypothetical protein GX863_01595 [Firmicutes bacterium]|jgi:hypothetical protein|nr:hypothetical protein [Candidatus Fermentithermobacillaceae bacterium]
MDLATAKVWAGALCTFAIYSFLWKENRFFRAFQNLYVGLAAGYSLVVAFNTLKRQAWVPLAESGDVSVVVPIVFGILLFTRLSKKYGWIARYPMALLMGIGSALSMKAIESDFVRQIQASIISWKGTGIGGTFNNLVLSLGTAFALVYFFFTFKPTKASQVTGRLGRWVLMLCFGAAFGSAVQGRLSLLISQMQFLLRDWLRLIS